MVINDRDCYRKCSPNEHVSVQWLVENQTDENWPSIYYLRSYCHDQAKISTKCLEYKVKENDMIVI